MFPPTEFTIHAFARVAERLHLAADEVADLLDAEHAVPIGREDGKHRVHRLFYSDSDRCCFIAVQDERNGQVVTILPTNFAAWPIADSAMLGAEALAAQPRRARIAPTAPATFPYRILALFEGNRGIRVPVCVGRVQATSAADAIAKMTADAHARNRYCAMIEQKRRPSQRLVRCLIAREHFIGEEPTAIVMPDALGFTSSADAPATEAAS